MQVFGKAADVQGREAAGLAALVSKEDMERIESAAAILADAKAKGAKEKQLSLVQAAQTGLENAMNKVPLKRDAFKKWMAASSQRQLLPKKHEVPSP